MAEHQFGPYRLVRQVAVGGMAEIHLAKTKGLAGFEKYVALKMIHPNFAADDQFIQMLVDEAKIAVQLNHANIAQTFDLGRVGDTYYITMEYVDGADLYKILRRGSQKEVEIPLDVCAFVVKEVGAALDHAHRKRDLAGKTLGIVHRDVSPQNVLISYAGEVKLVDFGIAKATMKVRQTAVGVIKGKYYYMSPEQASGDQVDYRSDIFSAGIVLYEMITGQMLYLEEDLNKLIDMARKANIAPPSTLRKGVPPQLESIVMHALAKDRSDRYQSAGDFATDLERFLQAYSPVFTAAKVAAHVKNIIGPPVDRPEDVEVRDGPNATLTLSTQDLVLDKEELKDENSVIFRVADLRPKKPTARAAPEPDTDGLAAPTALARKVRAPTGGGLSLPLPDPDRRSPANPGALGRPRVTRQANFDDIVQPTDAEVPSFGKQRRSTPPAGARKVAPSGRVPTVKPRDANEETRQVAAAPPSERNEDSGLLGVTADGLREDSDLGGLTNPLASGPTEDSGLLGGITTASPKGAAALRKRDGESTQPGVHTGDTGGDHTVISGAPPGLSGLDLGEEGGDATVISADLVSVDETNPDVATNPDLDDISATQASAAPVAADGEDEGTFPGDDDGPTLEHDFRDRANPKPKAAPRAAPPALAANIHAPAVSELRKPRASRKTPQAGTPTSTPNVLQALVAKSPSEPMPIPRPGPKKTLLGTSNLSLTYPQAPSNYGHQPSPEYPQSQRHWSAPTTPEIGDKYKVSGGRRGSKILLVGIASVAIAAVVTFVVIKLMRDAPPTVGQLRVESTPTGAQVVFDGVRLIDATPMTIPSIPVGTRHDIRIELPRHQAFTETVDIPKAGGEIMVKAIMNLLSGKVRVVTQPDGAEIRIDGQSKGNAPRTVEGLDMTTAKKLELRLKDHEPVIIDLAWPDNGEININQKLLLKP